MTHTGVTAKNILDLFYKTQCSCQCHTQLRQKPHNHCIITNQFNCYRHKNTNSYQLLIGKAHIVIRGESISLSRIFLKLYLCVPSFTCRRYCWAVSTMLAGDWSTVAATGCPAAVALQQGNSSKCKQCHVDSWCRKTNTDLFRMNATHTRLMAVASFPGQPR